MHWFHLLVGYKKIILINHQFHKQRSQLILQTRLNRSNVSKRTRRLLTKSISHYISLAWVIVNYTIIIFYQLQPSPLPQIQFFLVHQIFQTLMISVDGTFFSKQVMPPNFQCKHHRRQLLIMRGIILLMLFQKSRSINYHLPMLHQNTSQTLSWGIIVYHKVFNPWT